MNKRFFFLLFLSLFIAFLSFFGITLRGASAQSLAPYSTPTPNRTPPATPTYIETDHSSGAPDLNTDCPVGGIQNPTNATPDPLWLALCGHCLPTATLYPTLEFPTQKPTFIPVCTTPDGGGEETCSTEVVVTDTPIPTNTPVPTFTPFPTFVSPSVDCVSSVGFTCTQLSDTSIRYSVLSNALGNVQPSAIWHSQGNGLENITIEAAGDGRFNFDWQHGKLQSASFDIYDVYAGLYQSVNIPFLNYQDIGAYWRSWFSVPSQVLIVPDSINRISVSSVPLEGFGSWGTMPGWDMQNMSIYVSVDPVDLPTPIPTVTPIATPVSSTSYCSSVNNGVSGLENQDIGFWFPSGPPSCIVIPSYNTAVLLDFFTTLSTAFSIFLPLVTFFQAFSFFSLETPAMTICLQAYDFLDIRLFGVVLLFQTFADVVLAVFIVSHLKSK